jgi:PcfJ-like protein
MKGRTPAALIRDVNEWHRMLQVVGAFRSFPRSWQTVRIADFEHIVGTGEKSTLYTIRQLNKQSQLYEEGNALNHCVASYIGKCVVGSCSIWAMEVYPVCGAPKKLLTIELDRSGTIVQVRGKNNRLPTAEEIGLIRLWRGKEGLRSIVF